MLHQTLQYLTRGYTHTLVECYPFPCNSMCLHENTETTNHPWAAKGETICHLCGLGGPRVIPSTTPASTQGPSGWCLSKSEQVSWEAAFPGRLNRDHQLECEERYVFPRESQNWFLITHNSTGSHKSIQILPTRFFLRKIGCLLPNQLFLPTLNFSTAEA